MTTQLTAIFDDRDGADLALMRLRRNGVEYSIAEMRAPERRAKSDMDQRRRRSGKTHPEHPHRPGVKSQRDHRHRQGQGIMILPYSKAPSDEGAVSACADWGRDILIKSFSLLKPPLSKGGGPQGRGDCYHASSLVTTPLPRCRSAPPLTQGRLSIWCLQLCRRRVGF